MIYNFGFEYYGNSTLVYEDDESADWQLIGGCLVTAGTGKARRIIRALPLVLLDIVATDVARIAAAVRLDGVFALSANGERTAPSAFSRLNGLRVVDLRNLRIDFEHFVIACGGCSQVFVKLLLDAFRELKCGPLPAFQLLEAISISAVKAMV